LRWIPNVTTNQINKEAIQTLANKTEEMNRAVEQVYNLPRNPISDHTSFIVTSTTIDTSKMDQRFNDRNGLFLLAVDKFTALSALEPYDEMLLEYIWQDMFYAQKFEFWDRAERKAIEILKYCNMSRGRAGPYNFGEQLITTKEILVSKHKQEIEEAKRKGSLDFLRKKQQPQQEPINNREQ
jgi:hypothetical protein